MTASPNAEALALAAGWDSEVLLLVASVSSHGLSLFSGLFWASLQAACFQQGENESCTASLWVRLGIYPTSVLSQSINHVKSQGQLKFKGRGNRLYHLTVGMAQGWENLLAPIFADNLASDCKSPKTTSHLSNYIFSLKDQYLMISIRSGRAPLVWKPGSSVGEEGLTWKQGWGVSISSS